MPRRTAVSNPADLLLRVARTADGLRITSPQLPNWAALARGPVPIAHAVDTAWRLLATGDRPGCNDELARWDAAAEALAASGAVLSPDDVIVVREGRRASGAFQRPTAVNGARHDPFAWTPLPDGRWQSPRGNVYPASTQIVQRVIAARERAEQPKPGAPQLTLDDVAS